MNKYDLITIPVIDSMNRLIGRITIDDVVDFIKEEADKDFQLAQAIRQLKGQPVKASTTLAERKADKKE